jgi:hypothetical protein
MFFLLDTMNDLDILLSHNKIEIKIVFMKRLRADKIQGMLATIRFRVFCHLACCLQECKGQNIQNHNSTSCFVWV